MPRNEKSTDFYDLNLPPVWSPIEIWIRDLERIQKERNRGNNPYVVRFKRLVDYRKSSVENSEKLDKSVRSLTKNAMSTPVDDSLLSIFMGLPDEVDTQPFTGLSYGRRILDPTSQRDTYLKLAAHADALLEYFGKTDSLQMLLADQAIGRDENMQLPKTTSAKEIIESAVTASDLYQAKRGNIRVELNWLSHALKGANPHRWYPSRQPLASDAPRKTYIKLLADLNRYVRKGQHVAIATLANANLPQQKVNPDELRKAWEPPAWWVDVTKKMDKP